jgi:hypothetical protein
LPLSPGTNEQAKGAAVTELKKGDRVWVYEEGSSSGQSGVVTGGKAFTDQLTAIWTIRLDGSDVDIVLPGKLLRKVNNPNRM